MLDVAPTVVTDPPPAGDTTSPAEARPDARARSAALRARVAAAEVQRLPFDLSALDEDGVLINVDAAGFGLLDRRLDWQALGLSLPDRSDIAFRPPRCGLLPDRYRLPLLRAPARAHAALHRYGYRFRLVETVLETTAFRWLPWRAFQAFEARVPGGAGRPGGGPGRRPRPLRRGAGGGGGHLPGGRGGLRPASAGDGAPHPGGLPGRRRPRGGRRHALAGGPPRPTPTALPGRRVLAGQRAGGGATPHARGAAAPGGERGRTAPGARAPRGARSAPCRRSCGPTRSASAAGWSPRRRSAGGKRRRRSASGSSSWRPRRERLQDTISPLEEGARQLHAAVHEAATAMRDSLEKHQALPAAGPPAAPRAGPLVPPDGLALGRRSWRPCWASWSASPASPSGTASATPGRSAMCWGTSSSAATPTPGPLPSRIAWPRSRCSSGAAARHGAAGDLRRRPRCRV